MCTIIIVKCSWDGLLEGRNCSCVWLFWCSELYSVDQTVTVQRGSVLDVRGPEWFWLPFCSLWISTVLGEWGGLYQWFAQQSGLTSSEVRFGSWAEPDYYYNNKNNNNLLHLYSIFLGSQSALHRRGGGISSTTTNVQHPPGWCDGSHIAPECPPHTGLLVERRQSDEANLCMGISWRPWWSEANGRLWPGCRGYTPTFFRRTSWDF